MRLCRATKDTMLSCTRSKYRYDWGAAIIRPVMRTGCTVIDADGTMNVSRPDTARGMPMECPPPSTRVTVGLFG